MKKRAVQLLLPREEKQHLEDETVSCLRCAEDLTLEELLAELDAQPHLAQLRRALSPERKLYLLYGESEEMLKLACTYIGTYHLLQSRKEDEENEEMELDVKRYLPLLYDQALNREEEDGTGFFGGLRYLGERQHSGPPWWVRQPNAPLCVQLGMGFVMALPVLEQMKEQRLIIGWMPMGRDEDGLFQLRCRQAMEEVGFSLGSVPLHLHTPGADTPYKTGVLRRALAEQGVGLARGTTPRQVLHQIQTHRGDLDNATIFKAVTYARLRRSGPRRSGLRLEDFAFLKHLQRSEAESPSGLPDLIGQEGVRRQLESVVAQMALQKKRELLGLPRDPLHYCMAFLGAPGTGKTTWAKWLGKQMERAGLLENTDMLCINAVELKGKYVGHTAPKVKEAFEDYGILLLDEAYSLAEGEQGGDGFSGEVLSQLCVELEKHGQDRLVIFAGYGGDRWDDPMGRFFDANPGIRSRVGFHIHFEDFRPDELARVYGSMLEGMQYRLPPQAQALAEDYFARRVGERDFGNCREARNLADRTKVHMARRLARSPVEDRETLCRVELEDVEGAIAELWEETRRDARRTSGAIGF